MDITEEFAEWAKRKDYQVPDDNCYGYYDLWAQFLDEEYNDQRNWPQTEEQLQELDKADDHTADVYGRVRDATICNDNISPAECIAILELVKSELLRDVQAQIDEG